MARILVIDDEELARYSVREMLVSEGHEVVEASNGRDGRAHQRSKPFDIVIADLVMSVDLIDSDVVMPEKEGVETIIEMKRDYPDLKIIAVSGGGKEKIENFQDVARKYGFLGMAQKYGADMMLPKPFTTHQLLECVDECLANR